MKFMLEIIFHSIKTIMHILNRLSILTESKGTISRMEFQESHEAYL